MEEDHHFFESLLSILFAFDQEILLGALGSGIDSLFFYYVGVVESSKARAQRFSS